MRRSATRGTQLRTEVARILMVQFHQNAGDFGLIGYLREQSPPWGGVRYGGRGD